MSGPWAPWGPAPWQPPPPLPPVVPARYVDGRVEGSAPPARWPWVLVSVVAALVLVAGVVVALALAGG